MGTIKTRQLSDHILEKIVVLVFISFHTGINIFFLFLVKPAQGKKTKLSERSVCEEQREREMIFFLFFCVFVSFYFTQQKLFVLSFSVFRSRKSLRLCF